MRALHFDNALLSTTCFQQLVESILILEGRNLNKTVSMLKLCVDDVDVESRVV